ncbi:hypothetical protein EJB05_46168 [Eragrostis curvula]|uniref:Uncharacterized protein n=1 Tax=Eragrostis curvula TaxID=38414 RepID=A0A5J9TMS2_9POAL|nr:hypothetical protein EJB05_46168 [Eragrostis curvula]
MANPKPLSPCRRHLASCRPSPLHHHPAPRCRYSLSLAPLPLRTKPLDLAPPSNPTTLDR